MNLIKLDAINSTNEFLKDNIQKTLSKELQVVYTFNQTKGKGQRGNSWESQPEKNIAISLGLFPDNLKVENQFTLSMLFSLFILNTLKSLKILLKLSGVSGGFSGRESFISPGVKFGETFSSLIFCK